MTTARRPLPTGSCRVPPPRWPVVVVAVLVFAVPPLTPRHGPASASTTRRVNAYQGQPPIAYVSNRQVFVLDGRGHPPHAVEHATGACCVAWAPDGAHIGFERGHDLWIAQVDGSGTRKIAAAVSRWAWAPDGEAIAATSQPIDGHAARGIDFYAIDHPEARLTLLRDYHTLDFSWAGLGRRIAVSASRVDTTPGRAEAALFMLEVAGPYGDCATLCPEPAVPVAIATPEARDAGIFFAGWSPNASTLTVWTGYPQGRTPAGDLELALVSPGGGPTAPLARTPVDRSRIQWSEAGDRLLVLERGGRDEASSQLLELCIPPLGCRALGGAGRSAVDPAWSDTGRMAYVATTATVDAAAGAPPERDRRLWVADGDGSAATVVAQGAVSAPHWLPDARHLVFLRDQTLWLVNTDRGDTVAIAGRLGSRPASRNPKSESPASGPAHQDELFAVSP